MSYSGRYSFVVCPPISSNLELFDDLRDVGDEPAKEDAVDFNPLAQLGLGEMFDRV